MNLIEYLDRDALMIGTAEAVIRDLEASISDNERASLAVPGGTTPGPVFDQLARTDLAWEKVSILLGDERQVPAAHERSNERLLRERLLIERASKATYLSIREEEGALPNIASALPISVLLLGMGADMHTASIFPGTKTIDLVLEAQTPLMKVDAPDGLEPRITLTGPVLKNARHCHVLITGDEKRAALTNAMELTERVAPIRTVLDTATVHWAA